MRKTAKTPRASEESKAPLITFPTKESLA